MKQWSDGVLWLSTRGHTIIRHCVMDFISYKTLLGLMLPSHHVLITVITVIKITKTLGWTLEQYIRRFGFTTEQICFYCRRRGRAMQRSFRSHNTTSMPCYCCQVCQVRVCSCQDRVKSESVHVKSDWSQSLFMSSLLSQSLLQSFVTTWPPL